jgi:hypothetical protein
MFGGGEANDSDSPPIIATAILDDGKVRKVDGGKEFSFYKILTVYQKDHGMVPI